MGPIDENPTALTLYYVRLSEAMPYEAQLIERIHGLRKDKALRYVKAEDRVRSAVGSLLIQTSMPRSVISLFPHGKPYVENGPCFSLSHGGEFIVYGFAPYDIGVDVEEIDRCDLKLVSRAFTKEEALRVYDKESFAKAWTRKEAIAKCQGDGIVQPTSIGSMFVEEGVYRYLDETYCVGGFEFEGHYVSYAATKPYPAPKWIEVKAKDLLQ